jgi:hypothetical protein
LIKQKEWQNFVLTQTNSSTLLMNFGIKAQTQKSNKAINVALEKDQP